MAKYKLYIHTYMYIVKHIEYGPTYQLVKLTDKKNREPHKILMNNLLVDIITHSWSCMFHQIRTKSGETLTFYYDQDAIAITITRKPIYPRNEIIIWIYWCIDNQCLLKGSAFLTEASVDGMIFQITNFV